MRRDDNGYRYRSTVPYRDSYEYTRGKRRRHEIGIEDDRRRPRISNRYPMANHPRNPPREMRYVPRQSSEYDKTGVRRPNRAYEDHRRGRISRTDSFNPNHSSKNRVDRDWNNPRDVRGRDKGQNKLRVKPSYREDRRPRLSTSELSMSRIDAAPAAKSRVAENPAHRDDITHKTAKDSQSGAAANNIRSSTRKPGLRIAAVCANNMNRSMATHLALKNNGFNVQSFGTATQVRLPSPDGKDHAFPFGTPYAKMLKELRRNNEAWYAANKIISMLTRNQVLKAAPQRWCRLSSSAMAALDLVICSEHRVFDKVTEEISTRPVASASPVHVLNLDTIDDDANAKANAARALKLCQLCDRCDDLETELDSVLEQFEDATGMTVLSSTHYM